MSLRGTSRKASELELEDDDDVVDKTSSSQASSSSNDVFEKFQQTFFVISQICNCLKLYFLTKLRAKL